MEEVKSDQSGHVESWFEHIRVLVEDVGPRGSTTEGEWRGSGYCGQVLNGLGLAPQMERFSSARSIYHPHLFAAVGLLIAFVIYPVAGRVTACIAALISFVALLSQMMELGLRDNLLRRLVPKGPSQNVVAAVQPSGEHDQDLVLMGHVDSHRTPIIFSTPRWLLAYMIFTAVGFTAFSAQVVLYILGAVTQWGWIWPVSIASAVSAILLIALCVQADRTPFNRGANDNASGAGLVLALAEQLCNEPLEHTRVWLVCSGCEEVQHYGATDFFRRHRADLHNPAALVFDSIGCAGPAWLRKEGIVVPFYSNRDLVALAEKVAVDQPELEARPARIIGGNTEMADSLRARVPAITLCGIGLNGRLPYWHQEGDTLDKIDPEVLARTYAFTWAFMQALDDRAAGGS
jgi:hypothetical protein